MTTRDVQYAIKSEYRFDNAWLQARDRRAGLSPDHCKSGTGMTGFYGAADEQESIQTLRGSLELGCNFWDTSDAYGPYTNEQLFRALLGSVGTTSSSPRNSESASILKPCAAP